MVVSGPSRRWSSCCNKGPPPPRTCWVAGGPSRRSRGLDASGRPVAGAVAIFVPLLSWISSPASSSLPLSPLIMLPSLALWRMTSSRSGIDEHQRTSGLCMCRSVRLRGGVNMESKESYNPPAAARPPLTHAPRCPPLSSPLQMHGLFGQHKTKHTPTPTISQALVSRGPPLCLWRLMMSSTASFIPPPSLPPPHPPTSSSSISSSCCKQPKCVL